MTEEPKLSDAQVATLMQLARNVLSLGDAVPQLQEEVNKRERKLTELGEESQRLQKDIAAQHAQIAANKATLGEQNTQSSSLDETLAGKRALVAEADAAILARHAELDTLTTALNAAKRLSVPA